MTGTADSDFHSTSMGWPEIPNSRANATARWIGTITEHTTAAFSCAYPKNWQSKLIKNHLSINLLRLREDPESFQLARLRETLLPIKTKSRTTEEVIRDVLESFGRERDSRTYRPYHCEAILGSLGLLAQSGNAAAYPGIDEKVIEIAKQLQPGNGAVTKK